MADTNFRGPVSNMGSLEIQGGTAATVEPLDGPNITYQGEGWPDPRNAPFAKDGTSPNRVPAFYGLPGIYTVDAVPMTFSSTALAASQSLATTTAVSVALITTVGSNPNPAAQYLAVGVPLIPQGTTAVKNVIAIDFGFSSGTTIANSTVVNVVDNTQFNVGEWIVIGNVANTAATSSLIAQVTSLHSTNGTGMTISVQAATAQAAPIGQANLFDLNLPLSTPLTPASTPTAVSKSFGGDGGLGRWHNPKENISRGVYVTVTPLVATSGTYSYLVTGYDVWGQLTTELINNTLATTSATTIFGKKAFKYIQSVQAQLQATTATVSVGVSDLLGLPIRSDYYQYLTVFAGNTAVANNVGFVAAVSTTGNPATNTTGDVRGTLQMSGIGPSTPITNVATSNGALKWTVLQDPSPWQMLNATPLSVVSLFGLTQSTT